MNEFIYRLFLETLSGLFCDRMSITPRSELPPMEFLDSEHNRQQWNDACSEQ